MMRIPGRWLATSIKTHKRPIIKTLKRNLHNMKTLTESIQQALNESLEGMLQSRTKFLSDNGNANENGMIDLANGVSIGENTAFIKAINVTGDILQMDIDGSTDAIQIKFFSDETLKEVIKVLETMVKKIK